MNGHLTERLSVTSEVKQGWGLSPTLFFIFINHLVWEINNPKCGVEVNKQMLSMFLFTDDKALIVLYVQSLQKMLNGLLDGNCV